MSIAATVVAVVLAASAPALAVTQKARPDGILVGRWFVTPYVFGGTEYDDNVFRASTLYENDPDVADSLKPQSDVIRRVTVGVGAQLPIRNSRLDLDYTGDRYGYREFDFGRKWSHDGSARLTANFSSGDRLIASEEYTRGFTDIRSLENGELTFQGVPYSLNRVDVDLSRVIPRRQGYSMRVTRLDFNWEPETEQQVSFFDYRGFDTRFEYLQPVPGNRWLLAYHERRILNNYRARNYVDPNTGETAWDIGVPFRKEDYASYQIGMRGALSRGQTFLFRVGAGRFRYRDAEVPSSEFRGIVGQGEIEFRAGARTSVKVSGRRRPLPSSFDTYYIVNELRVEAQREWLQYSRIGVDLSYARNVYGDAIDRDLNPETPDPLRRDRLRRAEVYVEWLFQRYVGVRLAWNTSSRSSSWTGADYDANVFSAGMTLGWY